MWKMFVKGKLKDVNMNYENIPFKKPVMPNQSEVKVEVKSEDKLKDKSDDDFIDKLGK